MAPRVTLQNLPMARRSPRAPIHNFYLKHRPWQIQPCLIAPVLPGETLQSLRVQCRAVTDPIKNRVIGWWDEYYFFYVKLRDLADSAAIQQWFMDAQSAGTPGALASDADAVKMYFQAATGDVNVNWVKRCLERVVDCYFRDEIQDSGDYEIEGLPAASINLKTWFESAIKIVDLPAGAETNPNLASTTAGQGDGTAGVYASEIQEALQQWEWARSTAFSDLTFEDFCETYGVVLPQREEHVPELLRYVRSWQYPSNTIDTTNGTARSAVSWSHQAAAEYKGKTGRKMFAEPGFIFGVTTTRPKCYLTKINSHAAGMLNQARAWLPPQLAQDPSASFIQVASGEPPFDFSNGDLIFDMKDLFLNGDQFTNQDLTADIGMNRVALPSTDLGNKKYPASTDADELFVDDVAGHGMVEKDGVVSLRILGRQTQTSPVLVGNPMGLSSPV